MTWATSTEVPDTVVQVAAYADVARGIRDKVPGCVVQQARAGATFGVTFLRRRGGSYVVVLTPEQWATYAREAARDDERKKER